MSSTEPTPQQPRASWRSMALVGFVAGILTVLLVWLAL
jgi:hypothetical protein